MSHSGSTVAEVEAIMVKVEALQREAERLQEAVTREHANLREVEEINARFQLAYRQAHEETELQTLQVTRLEAEFTRVRDELEDTKKRLVDAIPREELENYANELRSLRKLVKMEART